MAIMRTGFAQIRDRFNAADYLRRIDAERVLDHYGARNLIEQTNGKDGTREIVHSCLLDQVEPHHQGGDENPSAAMNVDKSTYICYSYWSGGIFEFIMKMERKEHLHDIVPVLGQFLGEVSGGPSGPGGRDQFLAELEALFRAPSQPLATNQTYNSRVIASWVGVRHPYATEDRRLSDRAYEELRLGYDPETRRLVFPHYVGDRLRGWQQRAIPERSGVWAGSVDAEPKYRSTSGFPKSSTVYNLDRAQEVSRLESRPVVVVESPMSVAWAVGMGFDTVVATFGATVTDGQIDLLRELGPVILWFDADGAGFKAERKVAEALMRTNQVSVVIPDHGKDLADYGSMDEVHAKLAQAKPAVLRVIDWKRKQRELA